MHTQVLAAKGITDHIAVIDLMARGGLDVIALLILIGWLYRRRPSARAMPLVLAALNIGLFAAMSTISAGKFPAGVGFGLFGILSLVRLRSAAFTLRDVAYTFVALVIALCTGLPERQTWLVVALAVVVLVAVLLVDDPQGYEPATRTVKLTLDRIYPPRPRSPRTSKAASVGRRCRSVWTRSTTSARRHGCPPATPPSRGNADSPRTTSRGSR
ncbi:DUF4956 domain-containing protein [Streptomyces sp. NPDC001621]|uniref:DUF4956 domain-containing protein n=1 Tax=Streptomyces sp. NPDC001621 TaxID=3364594 RepID=UPI0036A91F28